MAINGGFQLGNWGYPKPARDGRWKNPIWKWMITGGTPISENPHIHIFIYIYDIWRFPYTWLTTPKAPNHPSH